MSPIGGARIGAGRWTRRSAPVGRQEFAQPAELCNGSGEWAARLLGWRPAAIKRARRPLAHCLASGERALWALLFARRPGGPCSRLPAKTMADSATGREPPISLRAAARRHDRSRPRVIAADALLGPPPSLLAIDS
jgi:hypothetical protein